MKPTYKNVRKYYKKYIDRRFIGYSERELYNDDFAHVLQNTKNRERIPFNKLDDSYASTAH